MSELQTALQEYLNIRRQLGFKLQDEGTILPKFLLFVEIDEDISVEGLLMGIWDRTRTSKIAQES